MIKIAFLTIFVIGSVVSLYKYEKNLSLFYKCVDLFLSLFFL